MILLIDNYDSFTYNIYQQLGILGAAIQVAPHDRITVQQIRRLRPSGIVISPGPKRPRDSGVCLAVIRNFCRWIPILGVCLGNECIGEIFGAKIIHARKILHGKTSRIMHTGTGLFAGLSSPIVAARYNSLVIDRVPEGFDLAAWDSHKEIMAISHSRFPVYGIQFHPESFMTSAGDAMMRNFLLITRCLR